MLIRNLPADSAFYRRLAALPVPAPARETSSPEAVRRLGGRFIGIGQVG